MANFTVERQNVGGTDTFVVNNVADVKIEDKCVIFLNDKEEPMVIIAHHAYDSIHLNGAGIYEDEE